MFPNELRILLFAVTVILLSVLYVKQKFRYWKIRGVPYLEPSFPLGNLEAFCDEHATELAKRLYFQLKTKAKDLGGVYAFIQPWAMVTNLDFVKTILVQDSQYFLDRGLYVNERDDPLTTNLINIANERWKVLRRKLSPTFTGGKIKLMLPIMGDTMNKLMKCVERDLTLNTDVNLGDYLSRFTIDVIGSCAFGIECDSLNNPNSDFLAIARKAFSTSKTRIAKFLFLCAFRHLSYLLHLRWTLKAVEQFYTKLVTDVVGYRERENVKRNDLLDSMLQLKNRGRLDEDTKNDQDFITLNEIVANAHTFLLAGYDTSSATLKLCLLELAHHRDIQERLRNELRTVLDQSDNITYEKLYELKYLEQVIYETLRKHPPFGTISRCLTEDYRVPNMNLTLEKGMMVIISVLGFHHDPDIYPEPEKFDPERFSAEAIKSRHPYAFLSFGQGPRNCIGMRFALTQTKIALATFLLKYRVSPCQKTQYPIKYERSNMILTPEGGCWLKIEKN